MSGVQACKGCGGLFAFLPRGLCTECIDRREEKFQTVREWLQDHRGASVLAACQATGVEERLIAEFIREGRLEFTGDGTESVRDIISQEAVRARIASEIAARSQAPAAPPPPPQQRSGMKSRLS